MAFTVKHQCIVLALLFTIGVLASLTAARSLNEASMTETHEQWMTRYGRVYKTADEKYRRSTIFEENLKYIQAINRANNRPYKLGVNEFADLTNEEFTASRNRFKSHVCATSTNVFRYENVTAVPSTMDWRKKGAVTPIKDQGQCGKSLVCMS